jgi:uncharacterized protein (DUF305 family)
VLPTSEAPTGADEPEAGAAPALTGPGRWTRILPGLVAVVALCALAGIIGFVLGSGRPPDRGSADVGFLLDMAVHHEQGVAMSNLELINGGTEGVQVYAREVLRDQSYDLGLMQFQLGEWGYQREQAGPRAMQWMDMDVALDEMPGMATEDELELLRNARGRDADAIFLTLMIEHHRGGVHMASFAAENAGDEDVRRLAARIARNQEMEIEELEAAGSRYGLLPG